MKRKTVRKFPALFLVTAMLIALLSPAAVGAGAVMEEYYLDAPFNDGDMRVWFTDGMDGKPSNLDMSTIRYARQLVVEFAARPSGNLVFVLQSETNGWWAETSISRPEGTDLTIELAAANTWADFIKAGGAKFTLVQWGANLQINNAYLTVPKMTVIESEPDVLTYEYGEDLDLTGMVISVYNPEEDDYSTVSVTNGNVTVSGYNSLSFGVQTVTVTYRSGGIDYAASFDVLVDPPAGGLPVTIPAIDGVAPPRYGATPAAETTETYQFTGEVSWDLSGDEFDAFTVYTATITLTAKYGYSFGSIPANFFKVAGAVSVENDAGSGVITAVFPATKGEVNKTVMRDITAAQAVSEMNIGWNLGNTFDATGSGNAELAWINIATTKAMIDKIADAGFDVFRIPITWTTGGGEYKRVGDAPDYEVNPAFLDRIEELINWGLDNGMYVIINMHHEDWMTEMTDAGYAANNERVAAIWEQVAERYKDYGDHLIFETMNEPRNGDNWTGSASNYKVVNDYNKLFLEAIRATGGNNEKRFVMMPSYAASSSSTPMNAFVLPDDIYADKLIASVHSYSPYNFCLNTDNAYNKWGTAADKQELKLLFSDIDRAFLSKGIPVVLGEFGAMNKNNEPARAEWAKYYISGARQYGIPCVWWDNNAFTSGERFGLLNRSTVSFPYPQLLSGLMTGLTYKVPIDLSLNSVYDTASGGWQIAAKVKNIDRTGIVYSGDVNFIGPAGYVTTDSLPFDSLAYGAEVTLFFDIDPSFTTNSAQVAAMFNYSAYDAENDIGYEGEDSITVKIGSVTAVRSADPVVIDGDLSDSIWRYAEEIDFAKAMSGADTPNNIDPSDLSVIAKLAWDAENLYVALDVTDNVHYLNQSENNIWNGDGIQVAAGDDSGVREMGFALHNNGNKYQYCWTNSTGSPAGTGTISASNAVFAVVRDDAATTTKYEIAIKWSYLGMDGNALTAGDIAKITLCVNDGDMANHRQLLEYGEGVAVGVKGYNLCSLILIEPEATVSISGPTAVANGSGETAEYTVYGENLPNVSGVELEFVFDGAYLSGRDFTPIGFDFIGDGNYDSPVYWRNEGNKWIGKVTLVNLDGGVNGNRELFKMTYDTVGGAYGDTEVTINYILLSYEGEWVPASVLNGTAATSIVKYFSPYDLNRSGEVDLNDLTYALMYFMTNSGDAGWDKAKAADFNGDGVVDVMDLILILANYTIPYYG